MPTECKYLINVRVKFFRNASGLYNLAELSPATEGSAGFDLRADLDEKGVSVAPGGRCLLNTGLALEPLREGVAAFIYSRSGLGGINGLVVAQGVGVIDPDYRGEIRVPLLNTGGETLGLQRGDRVAQMIFQPFYRADFLEAEELGATRRGGGGFGHTGKN
ncbi:MAG: dUTP diphosphatase [Deltaproteobacteria bacterium]|jgi:dUTP pyrophosphatase|nr:dUTP diphosphatase [Deltaproteobacteria bacterium]